MKDILGKVFDYLGYYDLICNIAITSRKFKTAWNICPDDYKEKLKIYIFSLISVPVIIKDNRIYVLTESEEFFNHILELNQEEIILLVKQLQKKSFEKVYSPLCV